MITFAEKDYNLKQILDNSKLLELKTDNHYNIIGLKQDKNCVEITYDYDNFPVVSESSESFQLFCNVNGLTCKVITEYAFNYDKDDENIVKIGFRKDLREHIDFSARLLKTAVNLFEGKLKLKDFDYMTIIKGAPKLLKAV